MNVAMIAAMNVESSVTHGFERKQTKVQADHTDSRIASNRAESTSRNVSRIHHVQVDFTQQGWKQFTRLKRRLGAGFIKVHVLQNELAHYLAAHEAAGVQLDTECQEVRYDDGVYLLLRKSHGVWYITEAFAAAEAVGYQQVYFWQQIKRGVSFIMARVLIGWQRLTGKQSAKQQFCRKAVADA